MLHYHFIHTLVCIYTDFCLESYFVVFCYLFQVLLAMHANVEDRGIKGDITPLMAAASGGYVDIVKLLLVHGADVNAQSSSGTTTLPVESNLLTEEFFYTELM